MPVRLRFSLHGHRRNRILHLVAVNQSARRDAKPIELLGIYHRYPTGEPQQKTVEWSVERIRYWLNVGAIPTKAVCRLMEAGNILMPTSPYHSASKITSTSKTSSLPGKDAPPASQSLTQKH